MNIEMKYHNVYYYCGILNNVIEYQQEEFLIKLWEFSHVYLEKVPEKYDKESVLLLFCRWAVKSIMEEDMEEVLKIVVMGRAARNTANIKNRQPIGTMFVKAEKALSDFYQEIIEEELNVKEVKFTDDVREFTTYTFKPQLKTVGPKYGKQLGGIKEYLANVDGNEAMDKLNAGENLVFDVNGTEVSLSLDDVLVEMSQKEGYMSEADNTVTVVLDCNLSEELVEEGFAAEIISKIQTMRKDSGFEVMDHIKVGIAGNDKLAAIAAKNEKAIADKVLADSIDKDAVYANSKEWNVNGEKVTISVEKQ